MAPRGKLNLFSEFKWSLVETLGNLTHNLLSNWSLVRVQSGVPFHLTSCLSPPVSLEWRGKQDAEVSPDWARSVVRHSPKSDHYEFVVQGDGGSPVGRATSFDVLGEKPCPPKHNDRGPWRGLVMRRRIGPLKPAFVTLSNRSARRRRKSSRACHF